MPLGINALRHTQKQTPRVGTVESDSEMRSSSLTRGIK